MVQPTEADSNLIFFVYPVLLLERSAVTVGNARECPFAGFCTRDYAIFTTKMVLMSGDAATGNMAHYFFPP